MTMLSHIIILANCQTKPLLPTGFHKREQRNYNNNNNNYYYYESLIGLSTPKPTTCLGRQTYMIVHVR